MTRKDIIFYSLSLIALIIMAIDLFFGYNNAISSPTLYIYLTAVIILIMGKNFVSKFNDCLEEDF